MGSPRGVDEKALAIVREGYRQLAKHCHPDAGGSHVDMVALNAAKETLEELLGVEPSSNGTRPKPPPKAKGSTWDTDEWVSYEEVTVLYESEKAILCEIDEEEMWIPKSQIHDDSEVYKMGSEGILIISKWIAKKKGLI